MNNMTKGFTSHYQIDKMIPKSQLEEGATYKGYCRNASIAIWENGEFTYIRTKFGNSYPETAPHPDDDRGFDCFVPHEKLDNENSITHRTTS